MLTVVVEANAVCECPRAVDIPQSVNTSSGMSTDTKTPTKPVAVATGAPEGGEEHLPAPTITTESLHLLEERKGTHVPMPPHFATRKWYAPFLAFHRWGPVLREYVSTGNSGYYIYTRSAYWQCLAPKPSSSGEPGVCGAIFHTGGVSCDSEGKTKPSKLLNFDVVPDGEEWPDEDCDTIPQHFRAHHGLNFRPTGRWTTPLLSFCEHRRAAGSCLLYYFDVRIGCCSAPDVGYSFRETLGRSLRAANGVIVPSPSMTKTQCVACSPVSACGWAFLGLLCWWGMLLASSVTCCGFPCASKKLPPLFCFWCYEHRRAMVDALGADESDRASRCIVIWCFPCSEVQVWRELHYSGVWPGLACCEADADDRARMAPEAVWQRYGLTAGGKPVGVHAVDGRDREDAERVVSMLPRLPAPVVAMQ